MEKEKKQSVRTVRGVLTWMVLAGISLASFLSCITKTKPVYTLTTIISPSEAGSISPAQGEFNKGEQVQVTASANEHWVFTGWGGDYSGTSNPATIKMNKNKSLTALFEKKEYALTINIEGQGEVEEVLVNAKTTDYPAESVVQLTALPAGGWEFTGWSGALSGEENPATVTVTSPISVTAMFEEVVHVTVEGNGDVEIEYIDDEVKEKGFSFGRRARFRAYPWSGWRFVSWAGDLKGSQNPIETTIDSEMTVNAIFVSESGKWVVQKSFSKPITSLFFINENEGWVTTTPDENAFIGGSIYHTEDGGETWTEQLKGDPYKEFYYRIEFADENHGWAIMQNYVPENPEETGIAYGAIMYTSNGGQAWEEQHFINGGIPFGLEVINANTVWVVGADYNQEWTSDGIVLHTSNGGQSWTEQVAVGNPGGDWVIHKFPKFTDSNTGWIFGDPNNLRTTNGGNSWGNVSNSLFNVDFVDGMNGYGLQKSGNNVDVYRTSNQGDTWEFKSTLTNFGNVFGFESNNMKFVNSELGWVSTANGDVMQTTDGAISWKLLKKEHPDGSDANLSLGALHFVNSQTGWATGWSEGEGHVLLRYVSQ